MTVPIPSGPGSGKKAITGETVSFAAGAIGTTGVTSLAYAPVFNAAGTHLGDTTDTSLAWTTGTVVTKPVPYDNSATDAAQLAKFVNGNYAVDYTTGRIRYKKATTGTSDTAAYTTREYISSATISPGDIEIGAVEIKNASSDDRVNVSAANTARSTSTLVLCTQNVDAAGAVLSTSALATEAGNLATIAADTTSIDGKITACDTSALATEAGNLATIAADTTSIDGKITACDTSALATEAGNLATIAADTTSIDGKIVACDTTSLATESSMSSIDGKIVACDTTSLATEAGNLAAIAADTTSIDGKITACDTTSLALDATLTGKTQMTQITDGTSEADVLADVAATGVNANGGLVTAAFLHGKTGSSTGHPVYAFDLNTDAKVDQFVIGVSCRTAANGGSIEGTKITNGTNILSVDGSGYIGVNIASDSAGLATEAGNLATIAADTTSIDGKITACDTTSLALDATLTNVILQGLQRNVVSTSPIVAPAAHTTETISEDSHAFDVDCAVADKVYDLGVAVGVIDGTNQYAVMELTLAVAQGTSNPEAIIVKVYRDDTADGNDPATTPIAERAMVGEARVYIPVKPGWDTAAVKITCSNAIHIYGDVTGVYYTPNP